MKTMYFTLSVFLILLIAGCQTSKPPLPSRLQNYSETIVYDKSTPFPSYGCFNWLPANEQSNQTSVKDHQLVKRALRSGFARRGFRQVKSDKVDFYVAYYYSAKPTTDKALNQLYPYNDTPNWAPGMKAPLNYKANTLIIDIVSIKEQCPCWRGSLHFYMPKKITPPQRTARFKLAVDSLLERFPPKKK